VALVSEQLYLPSTCRLSAKLLLTFEERICRGVSVTDAYGRIFGLLDRSRYFSFQVAPQLYSPSLISLVVCSVGPASRQVRSSVWRTFVKAPSALSAFVFSVLRNGLNNSNYWVHRTIIQAEYTFMVLSAFVRNSGHATKSTSTATTSSPHLPNNQSSM
jgi:hypothetical protein